MFVPHLPPLRPHLQWQDLLIADESARSANAPMALMSVNTDLAKALHKFSANIAALAADLGDVCACISTGHAQPAHASHKPRQSISVVLNALIGHVVLVQKPVLIASQACERNPCERPIGRHAFIVKIHDANTAARRLSTAAIHRRGALVIAQQACRIFQCVFQPYNTLLDFIYRGASRAFNPAFCPPAAHPDVPSPRRVRGARHRCRQFAQQ